MTTGSEGAGIWNLWLLWRVAVGGVLCTASTAAVLIFAAVFFGQLLAPASRGDNLGLYEVLAGIAALVAAGVGVAGGLLTALGSTVGLLIARNANLSARMGSLLIGACGAAGSLGAFALSRPSMPGWALGAFGVLVIGVSLFGLTSRFLRRSPAGVRAE